MQDDCQSEKSYLHLLCKLAQDAEERKHEDSEGIQDQQRITAQIK
jgi:hypothetical protein